MAVPADKVFEMKIDFELGSLTKSNIAKKHGVSRPTLDKHAKAGEWIYQHAFHQAAREAEKKMLSNLMDRNHDLMENLTTNFLDNIDRYRQLVMLPLDVLEDKMALADGNYTDIPKEELDRLFTGAKLAKISIEALCTAHHGIRLALGMDKDQDVRRAREIHNEERNSQLVDPLDGMNSAQIQTELNQLKSRHANDIIMVNTAKIKELRGE